jgi:predicted RNA-binding Zn-ribbon protein involved in translation (DUF1610 family)
MPISFTCSTCGKKLKAPDNAAGKSSKCPGCGSTVTCPEPVYDAELVDAPPAGFDPYGDVDSDKPYAVAGPGPGAPAEPEAPSGEARRPCPMCGEMIVTTAAKCRYCGEVFDPALKKAKKKKKGRKSRDPDDEDLSGTEIAVGLLCSGIGCIAGVVWMIQGKPKGWKMVLLSIVADVVKSAILTFIQSQQHGGMGP